eukprot:scaffold52830_cov21-Tisochrysis_lutea.AAC.1
MGGNEENSGLRFSWRFPPGRCAVHFRHSRFWLSVVSLLRRGRSVCVQRELGGCFQRVIASAMFGFASAAVSTLAICSTA